MESNQLNALKINAIRSRNSRLTVENNELWKMMCLMQENMELRYALKDQETQVMSLSPPAPARPVSPKEKTRGAECHPFHCMHDTPICKCQAKGSHMEDARSHWPRRSNESGMCMKGCKTSDPSPCCFGEKVEGQKRFVAFHGENVETCYDHNMERLMTRYN